MKLIMTNVRGEQLIHKFEGCMKSFPIDNGGMADVFIYDTEDNMENNRVRAFFGSIQSYRLEDSEK